MQVDYDDFCRVTGCGSQSLSVLVMDSNPKRSKSDTVTYSDLLLLLHILFQFFVGTKGSFHRLRDRKTELSGQWGPSPRRRRRKNSPIWWT